VSASGDSVGRMTTVVLVHGAFHDGRCWERVRSALDERGVANLAPDLPLTGLDADAATVGALLDAVDETVVLCGHSYGGMVISQAASGRDDVDRLVYLCAVQLESDDEMAPIVRPTPLMEHLVHGDDGMVSVDLAHAGDVFYHDCEPEIAAAAVSWLRPMNAIGGLTDPDAVLGPAAWKTIRSTYVVCTDDRALHSDTQREMAKHADDVVEWDTSHSPMLSQPDLVAELLTELAGEAS
jgi:pimeloyl-ACP methyl ester carboxylesterase